MKDEQPKEKTFNLDKSMSKENIIIELVYNQMMEIKDVQSIVIPKVFCGLAFSPEMKSLLKSIYDYFRVLFIKYHSFYSVLKKDKR